MQRTGSTVLAWWRSLQRGIDIWYLWPSCKKHASNLYHARMACMFHAVHDPAWRALGEAKIKEIIDRPT